jgi:dTMP kinase
MASEKRVGPRVARARSMGSAVKARVVGLVVPAVVPGAEPRPGPPGARRQPGWFLAVEGGDGVGKSTQLAALAAWLEKRGYDVVTTREPGGTELGRELRRIVLHSEERNRFGARAEALLFAADRADHIERVVRPALERGAIVLTDRHVDSSIAYQSGGRGLAEQDVAALSHFATEGLQPDLTVLLDLDPETARLRQQTRPDGPDRLESESADFHARVRAAFRSRAEADPGRYLVLSAADPANVITAMIQDRLEHLLPLSPRESAEQERKAEARRAAIEAEREVQEKRAAAEREAARRAEEADRLAREAQRQAERDRRAAADRAEAERLAAEQARIEQENREREERAAAEREAERLRAEERERQAQADTHRRHEAELRVRQVEAEAKAKARERAAEHLAEQAAAAARTGSGDGRGAHGEVAMHVGADGETRELPVTLADDLLGAGDAHEPRRTRWRRRG